MNPSNKKSKRGVVLRILQQTRRLLRTRYGRFDPFSTDPSVRRKHVGIYSALQRAMSYVEDADRCIGEYKDYAGTAMAVIQHVQRRVLGTPQKPFWEEDAKNPAYSEAAKKRLYRIIDTAIRVIKEDDRLFD